MYNTGEKYRIKSKLIKTTWASLVKPKPNPKCENLNILSRIPVSFSFPQTKSFQHRNINGAHSKRNVVKGTMNERMNSALTQHT